jgi:alcohol dehydrogenase
MLGDHARPAIPMDRVIAWELEILGSHGMQAFRYQAMMDMIETGKLKPQILVGKRISLEEAPAALMNMDKFEGLGISVITQF